MSSRAVEFAPATTAPQPPVPVFAEHELARVTASDDMSSLRIQFDRLAGTTEFRAATAYRLPPMWMVDGNLASGRFRWEMNDGRERMLIRRDEVPTIRDVAFCSSSFGNRFFGHHLTDDLPLALAVGEFAAPHYADPPGALPVNIGAYRAACGIDHASAWTARVEGCWVCRDAQLNDSKVARIEQMRSAVASAWGPGRGHDRVYVHRGRSGRQRAPVNEPAIIELLEADGWAVIVPELMTTEDVARSLFDARIVAGVEGSQLAHAVLAARAGAGLVSLNPPNRFNLLYKDFCDRLGLMYGFHVGVATESGWEVDLDGARRVLDRLDERVNL